MNIFSKGGVDFGHPFNTFVTDPAHNGNFNGVTGMIMQNDEDVQKLIAGLKQAIDEGYNPNDVLDEVCNQLRINLDNMLDYDLNKVKKEVDEYMQRKLYR